MTQPLLFARVTLSAAAVAALSITGCSLEPGCDNWQDCPTLETCSSDGMCVPADVGRVTAQSQFRNIAAAQGSSPDSMTTSPAEVEPGVVDTDPILSATMLTEVFDGVARVSIFEDPGLQQTSVTVERVTDDRLGFVVIGLTTLLDDPDLEPGKVINTNQPDIADPGISVQACASTDDGMGFDEPSRNIQATIEAVDGDPDLRVMRLEFDGVNHEGTASFPYSAN